MNFKFQTGLVKVVKFKNSEYAKIIALDTINIEGYSFIVDSDTADTVNEYNGKRLIFEGYTYYNKDTKKYGEYLGSITCHEGDNYDVLYEYKKSSNNANNGGEAF